MVIERMFDRSLPEPSALHSVDDATLVGAIEGWAARASAAADARRLAAIAELSARRCEDPDVVPPKSWRVSYAASGLVLDSLIS
jgi:hypothetical protein